MLKSPAWQDLSDKARLGYINIKFNHYGDNAKDIKCPFKTLVNRMAPATWAKAIRELQEHGFITLEQGSRGLGKLPNIYGLSGNWKDWGTAQFIKPIIPNSKDPDKGFSKLWKEDRKGMLKLRKNRQKKRKSITTVVHQ